MATTLVVGAVLTLPSAAAAGLAPTSLLQLVQRNDLETCRQLLQVGMKQDIHDPLLRGPLHLSAIAGQENMTRLLLAFHADVDQLDATRRAPLHHAAAAGHIAVARALVQNRATLELQDEEGESPLHLAARPKRALSSAPLPLRWCCGTRAARSRCRLLLARRADPNATDDRSWTPLTSAAARGHRSAVLALLAASSTAKRSAGPLGAAARAGHSEVVKLLLEHHFDPEEPFEGFLPLQWAEAAQHTNVLELLTSTRLSKLSNSQGMPGRPPRKQKRPYHEWRPARPPSLESTTRRPSTPEDPETIRFSRTPRSGG
ncbi:unnamed protein product [Durusdinium trenchii]|uniref:Uncharacterized protein n=1 Tax=Durusdinium trenchii TaxID=1381693 RepID=A0ABP0N3I2_9DINO